MITVIFLLLHAAKQLNSVYDSYAVCVCLGFDQLAVLKGYQIWLARRWRP